jgi:hypothetical protein
MSADYHRHVPEFVECYLAELPEDAPGLASTYWAKIVWVDRKSTSWAEANSLIGRWVARPWDHGSDCPWVHNKLYRISVPGRVDNADVKVGDFRAGRQNLALR